MTDQPPQSNRRDFLLGRALGKAVEHRLGKDGQQDELQGLAGSKANRDDLSAGYLEQYAKNAMGCEFEFSFNLNQYRKASAATERAFDLLDQLEDKMTVYRDHSQISSVNRYGFDQPVTIDAELVQLLQRAKTLHQLTGGAFAVTAGHLSELWGFERREGRIPTDSTIQEALECVGDDLVDIRTEEQKVGLKAAGVKINLGGIGKGYAIDQIGRLLIEEGIEDFVIHGGQSSVLACGSSQWPRPTSPESAGADRPEPEATSKAELPAWTVGISHPFQPEVRLAEVTLRNRALGTSGTARQGFFHRGKRYGHILDPRTGWPAGDFLSTTVIADQAETADALATAFFVMSIEEIESVCLQRTDLSVILVKSIHPGTSHVNVTTFNVAPDDWKLISA